MKKYFVALSSILVFFVFIGKLPFIFIDILMFMLMVLSILIYFLAMFMQTAKEYKWLPQIVIYLSVMELFLGMVLIKKISSNDFMSALFGKIGGIFVRENLYLGMIILSLLLIVQTILLNWVSTVLQSAQQVKHFMSQPIFVSLHPFFTRFFKEKEDQGTFSFHPLDLACQVIKSTTFLTVIMLIAAIVCLIVGQFNLFFSSVIGMFICFTFIHLLLSMGMELLVSKLSAYLNTYMY